MNARVIILTGALAAVACTKSEDRSAQDRAAGTTDAAAVPIARTPPDASPAARATSNGAETAGQTMDANNAGANDRDRQAVAPAEQGSSPAETEITAAIRKGILADDTLTSSPDVKVATVGTKVTLRGPVKSDQAKLAIAEIATRTAGVREVDNQLVVRN